MSKQAAPFDWLPLTARDSAKLGEIYVTMEKRKSGRVELNGFAAKLEIQGGAVQVTPLNVSEGGALILLPRGIVPINDEQVTILFEGEIPNPAGCVRRAIEHPATPGQYIVGIQFDAPFDISAVSA